MGTSVRAHVCDFPSLWQIGQTYMWKCIHGDGSRLYRRGGFVSRSQFFDTLKNGSLLGYFSLAAAKLSDSNLATTWAPQPLSLLMSNCNRPHIRATARADHICSSQHKYFVMNILAKTNSLTSQTVFQTDKNSQTSPKQLMHNLCYCLGRMI